MWRRDARWNGINGRTSRGVWLYSPTKKPINACSTSDSSIGWDVEPYTLAETPVAKTLTVYLQSSQAGKLDSKLEKAENSNFERTKKVWEGMITLEEDQDSSNAWDRPTLKTWIAGTTETTRYETKRRRMLQWQRKEKGDMEHESTNTKEPLVSACQEWGAAAAEGARDDGKGQQGRAIYMVAKRDAWRQGVSLMNHILEGFYFTLLVWKRSPLNLQPVFRLGSLAGGKIRY